ncbi:hypothetical protein ANO14919_130980 [Xylariales sp. No.14919]|nr:hypothetical protein ANO14919_130980 [Xylariales sp. No.14919]
MQNVLFMHLHNDAVYRGLIPHVNQTLDRPLGGRLAQADAAVAAVLVRAGAGAVVCTLQRRAATVDAACRGRRSRVALYFACDRGPAINVYDPLIIRSTGNITDAYMLVASLEAVQDWVETAFYAGVET